MTQSLLNPIALSPAVQLRNAVALAPMAGMTDAPMRTLAWSFGAGHVVSEMVSAKPELWHTEKSRLRRVGLPEINPNAVQIAGDDPVTMAASAQRLVDHGAQLIDINFGCPAKKVCRRAAGSALLADIDGIARIVAAVAAAVEVPVTVKTRTGLTPEDNAGLAAAVAAEQSGAALVVLHARSRACRFKGVVDYARIRPITKRLAIPVLVNGDIDSGASAQEALAKSGAAGIMVGRGAMGQPWLFAELLGQPVPPLGERVAIMQLHLTMLHDFYGAESGFRIARKHIEAYLQRFFAPALRRDFMQLDGAAAQVNWLLAHAAAIEDKASAHACLSVDRAA